MAAAASAESKQDATRLRRRCQDLITYAEQLKTTIPAPSSPRNSIIDGASNLHGNYFPPWDAPAESEFQLSEHEEPFTFVFPRISILATAPWMDLAR
jgi:calpain-7